MVVSDSTLKQTRTTSQTAEGRGKQKDRAGGLLACRYIEGLIKYIVARSSNTASAQVRQIDSYLQSESPSAPVVCTRLIIVHLSDRSETNRAEMTTPAHVSEKKMADNHLLASRRTSSSSPAVYRVELRPI